jgi:hypothetical protein
LTREFDPNRPAAGRFFLSLEPSAAVVEIFRLINFPVPARQFTFFPLLAGRSENRRKQDFMSNFDGFIVKLFDPTQSH